MSKKIVLALGGNALGDDLAGNKPQSGKNYFSGNC